MRIHADVLLGNCKYKDFLAALSRVSVIASMSMAKVCGIIKRCLR